jgi:hypothetical protein
MLTSAVREFPWKLWIVGNSVTILFPGIARVDVNSSDSGDILEGVERKYSVQFIVVLWS